MAQRKLFSWIIVLHVFCLYGCAGIPFRMTDVVFDDPIAKLGIVGVTPTEDEKAGVMLRALPPAEGVQRSREESRIFARIKENRGLEMRLNRIRTDRYEPGSREDSNIVRSVSEFEKYKGEIVEEVEMTTRGEILKFIQGFHESKIGKFDIVDWTRTPVFPEGLVKIGDQWTYEEMMDVRLKAWWVKQKRPTPHVIRATSKLTGFANVLSRRCAVIETHAFERKEEDLKVIFKGVRLDIYSDVREWMYLDYKTGTIVARVMRTESRTTSPDAAILDYGQSQSIYYIV